MRLLVPLTASLSWFTVLACTASSAEVDPSEAETETSGDGDPTTGDGDGDPATGDGDGDGDPATGDGDGDDPPPPQPDWLTVYTTGDPADAAVDPDGPGLILMGGGVEVDEAFVWQSGRISGGDVVVIRVSGSDGYNDYLYTDIGGIDSVQTLMLTSPEAAADPWVRWTIEHAEAVFMAGGDQADYMELWKDSGVEDALMSAWERDAILGGTSAGLAVLGEFVFAAYEGTVYPEEVLEDPYNQYMELDRDFLTIPMLSGVFTDSHFAERDRMGRLLGFAARVLEDGWAASVIGVGVDERTAMVIGPDGLGTVMGQGNLYLFEASEPAQVCAPGQALEFGPVEVHRLAAGDTATWPGGATAVPSYPVSAGEGVTEPADPY